jgi:hypothetical protein
MRLTSLVVRDINTPVELEEKNLRGSITILSNRSCLIDCIALCAEYFIKNSCKKVNMPFMINIDETIRGINNRECLSLLINIPSMRGLTIYAVAPCDAATISDEIIAIIIKIIYFLK